jgi:mono/diheme cytochrome c family protein
MIRGDWFLATATKPPLYHELLDLPDTLAQVEDDLNIDLEANINREPRPTAQRIGFQSSGVSQFNRMIERHRLGNTGGYFWLSYDFNNDDDRANLRDNPLGPAIFDRQNFNRTFEHAGGEVIYSLPNGMQGYLLLNAAGTRLDEAPKEIVKDPRRRAGAVTNGISCISCHGVTGMNRPRVYDEIVKYAEEHRNRFQARELTAIRELYPANGAQILDADAARYLTAYQAAGGARPEPGAIEYDAFINLVGQYEAKVGLRGGAMELGLEPAAAAALVQRGRAEDALPTNLADPLVTRDDFVCRMRRIVPTVGARPQFCRGTFTEDLVRNVCE